MAIRTLSERGPGELAAAKLSLPSQGILRVGILGRLVKVGAGPSEDGKEPVWRLQSAWHAHGGLSWAHLCSWVVGVGG